LLWVAVVVVAVGVGQTGTLGAEARSRQGGRDSSRVVGAGQSHRAIHEASPRERHAIAPLMAGLVDANIPPEALRAVARQQLALTPHPQWAQATSQAEEEEEFAEEEIVEYDPWESFNRTMFAFNRQVDRFILKPIAKAWDFVVPELAQQSLSNAFDNLAMPRRLINNLLQLKFERAGRELARFFLNTSMGVLGFFDAAADIGLPKVSDADTGLTLGYYGVGPGPYLVLPFLPPLTVRDAFGFAADAAMAPLSYFIPFEASAGMRGGQIINERSRNLEFFDQLERETFDLYTAVRNAYLQRRQRALDE
jgi:phospholipid-binding lipoprotein MlaA